ncbi:MAG TPA: hypothetical protein VJ787_12895 [Thermoleophilia bacterium]|nr:hypothetical protein [Thermoleophilia bacterium]
MIAETVLEERARPARTRFLGAETAPPRGLAAGEDADPLLFMRRDDRVRRALTAVVARALRERGYDGATYPFLAKLAGVEVAELERIFPSKVDLVRAAVGGGTWPASPFGLPGREIASRYLAFWERGDNTVILRELLRAAFCDRRLAAALERHATDRIVRPFAAENQ